MAVQVPLLPPADFVLPFKKNARACRPGCLAGQIEVVWNNIFITAKKGCRIKKIPLPYCKKNSPKPASRTLVVKKNLAPQP